MFRLCILVACAVAINGKSFENKIVGGEIALIQDYPYTVSVQLFGLHFCGGSIVSKNKIITAAHCLHGLTTQGVKIRAGSSKFDRDGQLVPVISIQEHEKYERLYHNYDIAILTLEHDLEFNESVQPIRLVKEEPSSGLAVVTGWGHKSEKGQLSLRLQMVELPIISREDCEYILTDFVTETMICAGVLPEGGKDSCQGDSGGPLVLNGELVGVVSFGFGCGRPHLPGLYTSIARIFKGQEF